MYPEPNCTELLSLSPDLTGECGAECEIILPDYCPNILRILQTRNKSLALWVFDLLQLSNDFCQF